MVASISSLPRVDVLGTLDGTQTQSIAINEVLPIMYPLYFTMAEWGPADDVIGVDSYNSAAAIFGSSLSDKRSKFYTHANYAITSWLSRGGAAGIRRLVAPDADYARLRLSVEIVAEPELVVYSRNSDGSYKLNSSGEKIDTGVTTEGYRLRWILSNVTNPSATPIVVDDTVVTNLEGFYKSDSDSGFGAGLPTVGLLTSGDGQVSTRYPIMDLEARFPGARGNNIGVRLAARTVLSGETANPELINSMGAYIYSMTLVERANSLSSPSVVKTLKGGRDIDFTFKEDAIDVSTDYIYYLKDQLESSYESSDQSTVLKYSPIKRVHIYHNNLNTVLDMLYALEKDHPSFTNRQIESTPEHTINILTGVDAYSIPYYTFIVDDVLDGGISLTESANHYLVGGSDGTVSKNVFASLVLNELTTFGSGQISYMDDARYPYNDFIDSGYPLAIKLASANILKRKDTRIFISTQDVYRGVLNTPEEDSSMGQALSAHFSLYAESDVYSTRACRVAIFQHAGYLIDSSYRQIVPFTQPWADLAVLFWGNQSGSVKADKKFDSGERAVITGYKQHNVVSREDEARQSDWDIGVISALSYGKKSIFWPAQQSIYPDKGSILHALGNVIVIADLVRVGRKVWRMFTGDQTRTDAEFLRDVDNKISEETAGRYAPIVSKVTPSSYFTSLDVDRGKYGYATDITMVGRNIKTANRLTIIAEREVTTDGTV